jgi:hypothetical protein
MVKAHNEEINAGTKKRSWNNFYYYLTCNLVFNFHRMSISPVKFRQTW